MALRLEIISDHRQLLGDRASIVFGVTGGGIGRALDNDWVLPDIQRYLSGRHARVHFRQGTWQLEDLSTNGVFVNDGTVPVSRRGPYTLRSGDVLRLGEYKIQVTIEAAQPLPPPGTGTLSQIAVERVTPLRAVGGDDLGASLNIEALIPGPTTLRGKISLDPGAERAPLSAQQRLTRLRSAARARLEGPAALADVRTGLQAFCRGAGIDPSRLPAEAEARVLHLAGQLLRESLLGLKEVMRAQQTFRDRFGIEIERPEETDVSPMNRSADEYLLKLFQGHEQRELDAVIQLRGSYGDAGAQTSSVDPALRAALAQFLAHLAPANIEARVRDRSGDVSPAAVWERYRDVYMTLLHATGQELPHLFTEALAQAFRRELDSHSIDTFKPQRD